MKSKLRPANRLRTPQSALASSRILGTVVQATGHHRCATVPTAISHPSRVGWPAQQRTLADRKMTGPMSCCGSGQNGRAEANGAAPGRAENEKQSNNTYESVSEYYGKVLKDSKSLKTGACTAGGAPPRQICQILAKLPDEVVAKFYGCGAPLPLGISGLHVLDLGSGSGRDCYVCATLVGESGSVVGVDMTDEQNEVAKRHADAYSRQLGYSRNNMRFVTGHIEYLDRAGIQDESVDLVISNCVVNLSPDKARVIREAYRVLRPGGEMHFSDVYADRRVPAAVQKNEVIWGECIGGALYINDFLRLAKEAGFADPRILHQGPIAINDAEIQEAVGNIRFHSITFRLFKLPGLLEPDCEDYGQIATYKGTIEGHPHGYALDTGHTFETGRPAAVCGNTAAMVGEDGVSWLAKHFEVTGDRMRHFGAFYACQPSFKLPDADSPAIGGSCC